jgi:hypothetical protein
VLHATYDLRYHVTGQFKQTAKEAAEDTFTCALNVSGVCKFIRNTGKAAGTEMNEYFDGMSFVSIY